MRMSPRAVRAQFGIAKLDRAKLHLLNRIRRSATDQMSIEDFQAVCNAVFLITDLQIKLTRENFRDNETAHD